MEQESKNATSATSGFYNRPLRPANGLVRETGGYGRTRRVEREASSIPWQATCKNEQEVMCDLKATLPFVNEGRIGILKMDRNKPASNRREGRSPFSAYPAQHVGLPFQRPVHLAEAIGLLRRDRAHTRGSFDSFGLPSRGNVPPEPASIFDGDLEFRTWLADEILDPVVQRVIDETRALDDDDPPNS